MKISHFQVDELEQAAVLNSSYQDPQDGKWLYGCSEKRDDCMCM
jgi:hypothetical protein